MAKAETLYTGSYVVRGNDETLEILLERLEKESVTKLGSPDLYARKYRSFGIDDANDIRSRASSKAVSDKQRVFALSIPSMTNEAQNALLKTLEEPAADSVFFLIVPSPETLLPTIRSRVQTFELPHKESELSVDADEFLSATAESRLLMLKPLYEHEDEGRDIGSVMAFLRSLERRFAKTKRSPDVEAGIHAIYRARKYATDKGSLLKSLLEQVALLAPKI